MEVYEDLLGLGAKRTASYNMCHVWFVKKKIKNLFSFKFVRSHLQGLLGHALYSSRLLFVCSHQFELKLAQRSIIKVLLQTDPHFASMITSGDENWNLSQLPLVEKQGTPWAGRQHNTELTQRDTQHDIHIHT